MRSILFFFLISSSLYHTKLNQFKMLGKINSDIKRMPNQYNHLKINANGKQCLSHY